MAVFRQVHVSFWQDAKVVEEMTPEDKYFYLYLLTNPNTTQIGIYQITKKQMAFDMGYSIETINALVDRFENYHKVIKYNKETREIALLNWGKYNFNRGGKPVEDCVRKELAAVKDKTLVALVAEKIENKSIKALFLKYLNDTSDDTSHDTFNVSGDDTLTTRGQEEEKEKEKRLRQPAASAGADEEDGQQKTPTNKELIAELVRKYREIEGVEAKQGDFPFIGKMYNDFGYAAVYAALDDLESQMLIETIGNPYKYLRGILKNSQGQGKVAPFPKRPAEDPIRPNAASNQPAVSPIALERERRRLAKENKASGGM